MEMFFNIHDIYYVIEACSRQWSTKRARFVAEDDEEYQAWLSCGNSCVPLADEAQLRLSCELYGLPLGELAEGG